MLLHDTRYLNLACEVDDTRVLMHALMVCYWLMHLVALTSDYSTKEEEALINALWLQEGCGVWC